MSKTASGKSVEAAFEITKKRLEDGEDVLISGIGKFCVKNENKRGAEPPALRRT